MRRTWGRPTRFFSTLCSLSFALLGCATSGQESVGTPPAVSGTHTVMGRAFFPGSIMVWVEAGLRDGAASGRMEYTRVESRQENTFRVFSDVECIGLFQDGGQAVVAGPVSRVDGDLMRIVSPRDWWIIHIEEGGPEGDLIQSQRANRETALSLCQNGPARSATLRAVDGDLAIH